MREPEQQSAEQRPCSNASSAEQRPCSGASSAEQRPCSGAPSARLAAAITLLQEKWTLFIIHALLGGPNGFNETGRKAGPVNTTTLAQRLLRLEQAGLVRKTIHSTMPPRTSYELTEAGQALRPVIEAIEQWGERYLPDQPPACEAAHGADPLECGA